MSTNGVEQVTVASNAANVVYIEGSLSQEIKDQLPEYKGYRGSSGGIYSGYGTDPIRVLNTLGKFGYKVSQGGVVGDRGAVRDVWTLQRTSSNDPAIVKQSTTPGIGGDKAHDGSDTIGSGAVGGNMSPSLQENVMADNKGAAAGVKYIIVTSNTSYGKVQIQGTLTQEMKDHLPKYDTNGSGEGGYGADATAVLEILSKFGYMLVSQGGCTFYDGTELVWMWTLQQTPTPSPKMVDKSPVISAMKHLVVESSSYTSNALLWGAVPPELRDMYKEAGCTETKHDAITVIDTLSRFGFRVVSQSQRDGWMSWTLGKQV